MHKMTNNHKTIYGINATPEGKFGKLIELSQKGVWVWLSAASKALEKYSIFN